MENNILHKKEIKLFNDKIKNYESSLVKQLWLPSGDDFVDIKLNQDPSSSDRLLINSWFSCIKQKKIKIHRNIITDEIFYSSPILRVNNNYSPNLDESELRIKTISLNLSKNLQTKIKEAIYVTRAIYNKCIELCCRGENPIPVNKESLRNLLTYDKDSNILPQKIRNEFAKVPSTIRDEAICDFIKAYKIQIQLLKNNKIKKFEMKFKRKKRFITRIYCY